MALVIVLDAGPLGLLCVPRGVAVADQCRDWLDEHRRADHRVIIPVVADFEVRRELLRAGARTKLELLDKLAFSLDHLPLSAGAAAIASAHWASLRRLGKPTAPDGDLDADALLAGVAATCVGPGDSAVIATTNTRHLARFPGVGARLWSDIRA